MGRGGRESIRLNFANELESKLYVLVFHKQPNPLIQWQLECGEKLANFRRKKQQQQIQIITVIYKYSWAYWVNGEQVR